MTCIAESQALDVSALRCPVGAPIPWRGRDVTLIRLQGGVVRQAKTPDEKTRLVDAAREDALLLAAWTGRWSTDVFHVCDEARDELIKVLA